MNRFRRLTIAVSLSLALVSVPAMTLAADATYAIRGVELPGATDDVGSFAGVAVAAGDYGIWRATIVHDAATITPNSGFFALDGKVRDVQGVFTSGSITVLTDPECDTQTFSKQTYIVDGILAGTYSVNGTSAGTVTADFDAVLTHYRIWWSGRCITYAATVKGLVTFHL